MIEFVLTIVGVFNMTASSEIFARLIFGTKPNLNHRSLYFCVAVVVSSFVFWHMPAQEFELRHLLFSLTSVLWFWLSPLEEEPS